jgi:hypothetical protein
MDRDRGRLADDFARSLAKSRSEPNLKIAYIFRIPAMEVAMLKQTGPALALSFLVVLSPATAMAYGGYFPPTEEAKPAPAQPVMKHHPKMNHQHQKKLKHHQAAPETLKMEERHADGGLQIGA